VLLEDGWIWKSREGVRVQGGGIKEVSWEEGGGGELSLKDAIC